MTAEIMELMQFGSAGAVIIVVWLFLKDRKEDRKSFNETIKTALEANNAVLNKVLVQLGKADR